MATCKECGQEFTPASSGSGLMPSIPIDTCPECTKAAEVAFHSLLTEATPRIFITPIIIAINLVVFVAMLATGVSFIAPQNDQLQPRRSEGRSREMGRRFRPADARR